MTKGKNKISLWFIRCWCGWVNDNQVTNKKLEWQKRQMTKEDLLRISFLFSHLLSFALLNQKSKWLFFSDIYCHSLFLIRPQIKEVIRLFCHATFLFLVEERITFLAFIVICSSWYSQFLSFNFFASTWLSFAQVTARPKHQVCTLSYALAISCTEHRLA